MYRESIVWTTEPKWFLTSDMIAQADPPILPGVGSNLVFATLFNLVSNALPFMLTLPNLLLLVSCYALIRQGIGHALCEEKSTSARI